MARLPKEPNRIIRTGVAPMAVAITNDGLLGIVALQGGSVAMFDLIGRHLVYSVSVGGAPHQNRARMPCGFSPGEEWRVPYLG